MIYAVTVVAVFAALANGKLMVEDPEQQKYMWEQFKAEWGKSFQTMEEEIGRFSNFIANLKIADQRNLQEKLNGGEAVHGITKFFDLSHDEFKSKYLKSDPSMRANSLRPEVAVINTEPSASLGLVDWSGKYTTPVKNQGYCGSCWAFSATEQIESDAMRTLGVTYVLSPEQITQCDTTSYGCNGGWTENAYNYVKKAGGIEQNSDYPYTSYNGVTGTCSVVASKEVIAVSGYTKISGESSMASYVQTTGPLSVCVDASSWNSYTGGIMSTCGKSVDHCVQAVGVDTSSFWKVRNSWGTSWGESGYIRLKYGANTCAITNDPTHVSVSRK
jgi:C1A family cysteine protease